MLAGLLNFLKTHPAIQVGVLVWGVAGPVLGYFGHDFLSYRSEERAEVRSDYTSVQQQSALIRAQLQDFSQAALGRRPLPTSAEINQLRNNISQLYAAAQHVVIRVPKAQSDFDQYSNAMLRLQLSAEQLRGPLNGRPLAESISAYLVAEKKFDKAVANSQCFFCVS